jgi:homoserine kinase type II
MSLSESVKQVIFNQWSFLVGTTFEPTTQGSSNTTYFVDTPDNRFVLKFYAATTETAQIHYEHSLLTFLQSTDLPFAIPVPICASSGETLIAVEGFSMGGTASTLNVALLPRLIGQPMDRQNLKQVQTAGFALAKLHYQLAKFDPLGQFARLPFWGALGRIHPQVSEPLNVPQILSMGLEEQRRFGQMLNEVIEVVPDLYLTFHGMWKRF